MRLVAPSTFDTLSSVRTSPGVVAVAARPPHRELAALEALLDAGTATSGPEGALVLGIAGIQDPGNLGALARAAEAAGARALLVAPEGARPFGPKALRGSMGSLLRLPVFELERLAVGVAAMEARGCRQYVAATRGGEPIASLAGAEPCCIWMTSETGDLPGELSAVRRVTIPMRGRVESLNVTVAGALLLFAAGGALS